jgi:hypothetical protein
MLSRRRVVRLGASGSLVTAAGCSRFRTGGTKPLRVSVMNVTDESHSVTVSVFDDDGDRLVEQDAEIAAAEPNDGTQIHAVARTESYPEAATFRVEATLDDDVTRETSMRERCGSAFDGRNVIVRIHSGPELTIDESCFQSPTAR